MKKPIMVLIIISAIVISAGIALAATEQKTWTADSLINDATGWDVMSGDFGGSFSGSGGVYSVSSDYSSAAYELPASSNGNFELDIPFTLNGDGTKAYVGLSTAATDQDTSGWTVIGNGEDAMGYSHGGLSNIAYFSDTALTLGQKYTAKLVSTDGGDHATLSVDGYPGSETVDISGAPKYVVLYLNNNGITGNSANVPDVNGITYKYYTTATSPTPTPSGTVTATPTPSPHTPAATSLDLNSIRDFYSHQPVVHMSNQSVVYNPDGTIKQVVTGTTTNVTAPIVTTTPANNTKPVVTTVPANVTASPKPVNATTVAPTTAAPTKSQSPGFEIILAAMGMIAALALITRKKK